MRVPTFIDSPPILSVIKDLWGVFHPTNKQATIQAGYRNADNGKFDNEGVIAYLWSSSPNGDDNAQYVYLHQDNDSANDNWNDRGHGFLVRPFLAKRYLSHSTMTSLTDLFLAYFDCRKNKRNKLGALAFEFEYESHLIELYQEITERRYIIRPSTAFIVRDPVKREIFAADFRDRIVHHLIALRFIPLLERVFIHDNYAGREGKWTLFGIQRTKQFLRACSKNYTRDCYILKLDIEGFFMSIDKAILSKKSDDLIQRYFQDDEQKMLLYLTNLIISNNPTNHCMIKWNRYDWVGLPKTKSLFFSEPNTGLPIGNLTSQIFANLYLHELDVFIKKELKIRYYGRYVDDFILIHEDKEYLKSVVGKIRKFLLYRLNLRLHPKKIYLQHYSKGVKFLWAYIKPHRTYILNRTKGNFYSMIQEINTLLDNTETLSKSETDRILSQINSYLGLFWHHNNYRLRKRMLQEKFSDKFWKYFLVDDEYKKIFKLS